MTALQVDPVNADFVAVVSGVDLSRRLDSETADEIERAIWKYGVLIFPDQPMTQEEQVAFASCFGPLYTGRQMRILNSIRKQGMHKAVSDISNVDSNGDVVAATSAKAVMNVGNWLWHTDASHEHHPFRYSILAAVAVTSWGGETQFADLRAAYDTLDDRTRTLIEGRHATFYSHHMRHNLGVEDSDALLRDYPPVIWPMVRTHPGSGRKVLWVDSKIIEVSGMSLPEGRALVHELLEHAGQRERVHSHQWSANDVVMWDNRSVLHRGRRFDLREKREMRRVATVDDSSSLGEGALPSYVQRRA